MKAAEFLAKSHYVEETSTVGGVPCDHLALRNEMTDAQVWITKGNNPLWHRLVITYRHENGQPEFRADFHDWNFSTEAPESLFTFTPAEGTARIRFVAGMDLNAGKNQERGAQP